MSTSTKRVKKKRETARAAGLCITCFIRSPLHGRVVCSYCNERAKDRVKKFRLKEAWLEPAPPSPVKSLPRQLLETASVLTLSGRTAEGMDLMRLASTTASEAHDFELAAEALENLCRQAWANVQTPLCLEYARRLLELPLPQNSVWRLHGFLRLARAQVALGNPELALDTLRTAAKSCDYTRLGTLATFLEVRSYAEHIAGLKADALRDYQLAVDITEAADDGWAITFILNNYAVCARDFGHVQLANQLHRRAISFSDERKLGWLTTFTRLSYVASLISFGELGQAKNLFSQLDRHFDQPTLKISHSTASAMLDSFGSTCATNLEEIDTLVDIVLASEEPIRIAASVGAWHRLYVSRGMKKEAQSLLSRALASTHLYWGSIGTSWLIFELLRYGSAEQLRLAARSAFTSQNAISVAFSTLVEGRLSGLEGDDLTRVVKSGRAEAIFRHFGFRYAEAASMEIGGRVNDAIRHYRTIGADRDALQLKGNGDQQQVIPKLTPREQDVLRLLLCGASLFQTSNELKISQKTAQHHLESAMQSLNVSRRAELAHCPFVSHLLPTTLG